MEKAKYIWFNGKFVDWDDAKIHILTHALHYGSGVFEGIRFYKTIKGRAVFRLNDHLKRLFYSAKFLDIKIPFSIKELKKAVVDLIKRNNLEEGYIRPIIFYGYGKMGLNPKGANIDVAIAIWPWGKYLKEKVKVKISKFIRLHPQSVISTAKVCGYYINSIYATLEASKEKYDEAILLDYRGYVAEGPGENVFIVKNNILYTPKPGSILLGITRDSVMKIAKDLGIKVREKDISVKELLNSDEVFFTGTAAEITPIFKINNTLINKGAIGPITLKIQETYKKITRGELRNYYNWLTFVK